jgi:transposase-like protein
MARESATKRQGRWTEEEARDAIAAWSSSGMTVCAYAQQLGITAQKLYWWRQKIAARSPASSRPRASATAPPPFVPVQVRASLAAGLGDAPIVITLGQLRVEVREVDAATAAWVGTLLSSREGAGQ